MKVLKIIAGLIIFSFLTILTQIGGVIFIVSLLTYGIINKNIGGSAMRVSAKFLSFVTLYLLFVFLIVPKAANLFGRVPLPMTEKHHLKPTMIWTCLLNRNYVRTELREIAFKVSEDMNTKYPGTTINYLDASFPFINKFPLFPHLSHNDGKKLDLSFLYKVSASADQTNNVPSFIGYGICEEPKNNEYNMPNYCSENGFWQYSLLPKLVSQDNKTEYKLDTQRTRDLVNLFSSQEGIGRIFIEPHLKTRLTLTTKKIVFHGCQAVRHDDHLHVQLR